MVALDVGIQTGDSHKNHPLIIANSVGLVVMAVWGWLAYRAVKHEDRKLAWILTVLLPIMYILPIVDITLGELPRASLCLSAASTWCRQTQLQARLCLGQSLLHTYYRHEWFSHGHQFGESLLHASCRNAWDGHAHQIRANLLHAYTISSCAPIWDKPTVCILQESMGHSCRPDYGADSCMHVSHVHSSTITNSKQSLLHACCIWSWLSHARFIKAASIPFKLPTCRPRSCILFSLSPSPRQSFACAFIACSPTGLLGL